MAGATRSADAPAIYWTLLILVILAPFPLASVDTWAWGIVVVTVGLLLAAWSVLVLLGWQSPAFGLRRFWPVALMFAVVVAWGWLQTASFMPMSWQHPLWPSVGNSLAEETAGSISVDPFDSRSTLIRLMAYGGVFWLALQYGRRSQRSRQALVWLTYAGMVYAIYGLAVHALDLQSILIFRKTAYLHDLTSTFVNRNSFATYAGLGLICATGLLIVLITQTMNAVAAVSERPLRVAAAVAERGWPLLFAWLTLLLALLLTHSRAGFAATMLGIAVLLVTAAVSGAVNRRLVLAFGIGAALVMAAFVLISSGQVMHRFADLSDADRERPLVYGVTFRAIDDSGALGTGLGSFEEVFRFYRTTEIKRSFEKAHSTYLENALELGLPVALLLFSIPMALSIYCLAGLRRRRRDVVYPCVGIAVTVLVGAHSIVDFSLQIPAVTITYAFIMGIACAQSRSTRDGEDSW